jgi:hypothetical protein
MQVSFSAQRWLRPSISRRRKVGLIAILAIWALPIVVGATLDLWQAYLVKARLQETVNATALQGTRTHYGATATFSTVFLRIIGISSLTVSVDAPSSDLLATPTHE